MSGLPQVQNMFRRAGLRREIVDVSVETPRLVWIYLANPRGNAKD